MGSSSSDSDSSSDSGHKHHKNKKSHKKKEKGRKMPDPVHGVSPGDFHGAGDNNQSIPGFPAAGSPDYSRNVHTVAPAMPGVPQMPVGGFDSGHSASSAPSGYGFGAAEYYSHSTPPPGGFPTPGNHQGVGYPSPPSAPPAFGGSSHFDRASPYSSPPFVPTPHAGAPYGSSPIGLPQGPNSPLHDSQHNQDGREFPNPSGIPGSGHGGLNPAPPTGHAAQAPPSGFRIPLKTGQPLPPPQRFGPPAAFDLDGSPIFFGSAIMEGSVHPCKIAPHLNPPCRVPYGGTECEHNGRYDLLPFDGRTMELVPTEQGRIPPGRKAVEGGFEDHGGKLYHALATISGVRVPGKTGEHLVRFLEISSCHKL